MLQLLGFYCIYSRNTFHNYNNSPVAQRGKFGNI